MVTHILKTIISLFFLIYSLSFSAYADNSPNVADELNALYNKTNGCTDGNPDFYCSGIILHAQTLTDNEPWYLPTYRDVGSFSYIRHDIVSHVGQPIWNDSTGYILTPPNQLLNAKQSPYEVYCSYPINGSTDSRTTHGCGDFKARHVMYIDYSNCASNGIFSLSQYLSKYQHEIVINGITLTTFDNNACSFSSNAAGFKLSMDLSKYILRDNPKKLCGSYMDDGNYDYCKTNNELIISAWQKEKVDASQVPIKAFFVLINGGKSYPNTDRHESLSVAFKKAADYSDATHQSRQIPVVTIDISKLKNGEKNIFALALPQQ